MTTKNFNLSSYYKVNDQHTNTHFQYIGTIVKPIAIVENTILVKTQYGAIDRLFPYCLDEIKIDISVELKEHPAAPQPVEFKRGSYDIEKNIIFYYSVCGAYSAFVMFRGIDPISAQFEWKYGVENIRIGASVEFDLVTYRVDETRLAQIVNGSTYLQMTAEEFEKELEAAENDEYFI